VRTRGERDRGAATVLVVAATGVVLVLLVAGLALASAVVATHTARAAADLGALAAAQALQEGADLRTACAVAASVTTKNGARSTGCLTSVDGSVTCRATTSPSFLLPGTPLRTTTATARAGPSP
jgi:secretion/DNA translocation related TadE-like protein